MNTSPLDDLVRRAREGNRDAGERLLQEVLEPVHLVARLRIGEKLRARPDSRDAVLTALTAVFGDLPKARLDGSTQAFLTWVHAAVEKRLRKGSAPRPRRPAPRPAEPDPASLIGGPRLWDPAASLASPGSRLEREEDFRRLEEALLRLDPEERDVLVLERFEGCLPEEIARRLGTTDRIVRKVRARALLRLARELKGG